MTLASLIHTIDGATLVASSFDPHADRWLAQDLECRQVMIFRGYVAWVEERAERPP